MLRCVLLPLVVCCCCLCACIGFGAAAFMAPLLQNLCLSVGNNEEACFCLKVCVWFWFWVS